jgi:hypothetical protein
MRERRRRVPFGPRRLRTSGRGSPPDPAAAKPRKEIVGDRVTVEPIDVIEHYGQTILRG